jgi:NitT/TauT family transport system ATP-binding protein
LNSIASQPERRKVSLVFVTHSVDEAIWLADRVVVMPARPGRIVDDLPVRSPGRAAGPMRPMPPSPAKF